jgi:hypothetical protein
LTGNKEFDSAKILAVKLRRKSVNKVVGKQEIPAIDLGNQILLVNQAMQDLPLYSNAEGISQSDEKEMLLEKRDNVDDNSF